MDLGLTHVKMEKLKVRDMEETNVFVDDFHTGSADFDAHVEALATLLERGRSRGVQRRITKCHFCLPKTALIGCEVSAAGRLPDPRKVQAFKDWPAVQGLQDLV